MHFNVFFRIYFQAMSLTMLKIITDQNAILNCLQKHSPIVDKTYVSPVIQLHSDIVFCRLNLI